TGGLDGGLRQDLKRPANCGDPADPVARADALTPTPGRRDATGDSPANGYFRTGTDRHAGRRNSDCPGRAPVERRSGSAAPRAGDAPVVGPVRGLRHYFACMAADYGADVVHIGASPEGFTWRDAMNMGHLDESAGDPGIWRVRTRPPPHNAYTDTAADRGFLQQMGRQQNHRWGPLLFDAQASRGEETAEQITLVFLPWPYRVSYACEAAEGR